MNAAWQCACCKRDLWALQHHTCESCAEVVCMTCAGLTEYDAETVLIAACPNCVAEREAA